MRARHKDRCTHHIDRCARHIDRRAHHIDRRACNIDRCAHHIDRRARHIDRRACHIDRCAHHIDRCVRPLRRSKREKEKERVSERCTICPEVLSLFSKGMTGALAPFSYLVVLYFQTCFGDHLVT
jgi:hypothetical protein